MTHRHSEGLEADCKNSEAPTSYSSDKVVTISSGEDILLTRPAVASDCTCYLIELGQSVSLASSDSADQSSLSSTPAEACSYSSCTLGSSR